LQKGDAGVEHAVVDDGVVGVARHVQDAHVRADAEQALGELAAAHARHHHVGEQEVDGRRVLLADEQRVAARLRLQHVVAVPAPVSLTASIACRPGLTPTCSAAYASSSTTLAVASVSLPPSAMASRAFTTRFITTCSICPGSTRTRASDGAATVCSSTSSPM